MLKKQITQDKNNELFRDDSLHQPHSIKSKPNALTPYLIQIEKRKKQRSNLQRSKKNVNQSSSKSFRIKDRSVTSLQKQLFNRKQQPKKQQFPKQNIQLRPQRQKRTQSVNRNHELEYSKTVQGKQAPTSNNFFNQLYSKVRNKLQLNNNREKKPFRKSQYQTLQDTRARSQQAGELSMYKISFTNDTHHARAQPEQQSQPQLKLGESPFKKDNNTTQGKKNNFRRNKYEVASQEVQRKDTNLAANINSEMDRMDARQNEQLLKARNRQLHGSIDKSNEKYFNSGSYRPIKSKNQIQQYISIVPNPSLHKASHSTNEKSDHHPRLLVSSLKTNRNNKLHQYDFDFKNDEEGLQELQSDPQSSIYEAKEHDQFQKQRRKVEQQFFHKGTPHLDWSEDECKIDQI